MTAHRDRQRSLLRRHLRLIARLRNARAAQLRKQDAASRVRAPGAAPVRPVSDRRRCGTPREDVASMHTRSLVGLCLLIAGCGDGTRTSLDLSADDPAPADDTKALLASPPVTPALGTVVAHGPVSCPSQAPPGATCQQITVTGCPGIETEAIDATVAVLAPGAPLRGTVTHFKGGGGEGFLTLGSTEIQAAGFRQVFVSWATDWEQTASHGIKTAACRPATVLRWIFDSPALHGGSRAAAFCAAGKSGGSAQLGYALANYGLASQLDYVIERAGPPFARIDLGCDGNAPPTTTVCGDTVTMRLPSELTRWENMTVACGSTSVPAAELARWKSDSIAVGGVYNYPSTRVDFFDCTNNAPAVTGMSQIFFNQIVQGEGGTARVGYHCYSVADHCQGEDLGDGDAVATQAMIDNCIPHH